MMEKWAVRPSKTQYLINNIINNIDTGVKSRKKHEVNDSGRDERGIQIAETVAFGATVRYPAREIA